MKIGQLAEKSGFSRDTIRYYQELGLFQNQVRKGENNYREFTEEALEILNLIKESKLYGFTLKENKAILEVRSDRAKKLALMEQLTSDRILKSSQEIRELETRIERLKSLKVEIQKCRNNCL